MPKILFIGHVLEASAWGSANQNFILALDRAGIEVVPRAIKLGKQSLDVNPRILELMQQNASGCDICLQWVLPHHFMCTRAFKKNIGYLILEHHGISSTPWPKYINLMDELWVPSQEIMEYASYDGITKPVQYVPHAFDFNVYEKSYQVLPKLANKTFRFYFIGELHRRKRITSLIRAFHNEFHANEPVELVLKVSKFGCTPEQVVEETRSMCAQIKESLRLYRDPRMYKNEVIIGERLTDEEIYRLHASCDCYVTSTCGEAFNIPAFEAMLFGNTPICTDCGAMRDYIEDYDSGVLVSCEKESIIGMEDIVPEVGTGREWWWHINTMELQKKMRLMYYLNQSGSIDKMGIRKRAIEAAKDTYSYEAVAKRVGGLLNA